MMTRTQTERLLDYFKRWGKVTQKAASEALGIARLASRVEELRRGGHQIETEMITVKNRFGQNCSVAEYQWTDPKHERTLFDG